MDGDRKPPLQTVSLLDDDPLFRAEVAAALRGSEFLLRAQADSLGAALQWLAGPPPSLALVDIALPDGLGLSFLAAARERWGWACQLFVISSFSDEAMVRAALRHGAQGYVTKGLRGNRLLAHLRKLVDNGFQVSPIVARMLLREAMQVEAGAEPLQEALTGKEFEVLQQAAEGLINREIADQMGIGVATVKSHLQAIYDKCAVSNRTAAVRRARELGWL